ncbi:ferroxidase [Tothia fuscella]|uniref:Ferroxidase n=1 Tax=Tothia fuscella TaxID=1048955 RepID=A0A9P4NTF4_9PEZI|nr:ferroxidase [Tothia fuscella]
MLRSLFLSLGLARLALCATHNWDVTWVNAAPDGFNRPVIGINGKWPPPTLEATVGEELTVVVHNKLGNETTSVHWHGLRHFQKGTMDGPAGVTQCPIPPGGKFTYQFTVDEPGTYWYHAHNGGQYPDGFRAPLIVKDKAAPWAGKVEAEYTITLSDWYHEQMPTLLKNFQSTANPIGAEPIPDSVLINDGKDATYPVKAGKTYLFRVLNIGAFPSFFFNVAEHEMQIVEMDGEYTEPTPVKTFYIGAGMRYSFLLTAKTNATKNFDISALVDTSMFSVPANFKGNPVAHASLQYGSNTTAPVGRTPADLLPAILPPYDDATIKPLSGEKLLGPVNQQVEINFDLATINGLSRARINNITYLQQKVPTLYTALTAPDHLKMNPKIYGVNSNPIPVKYGDVVELVINNFTPGGHPWHLHGHKFQTVARSLGGVLNNGTRYNSATAPLPPVPMKRDVVGVRGGGYTVIRFKADNPGVQLLHCHIEWHVAAGLTATIIEAADKLDFKIPHDHLEVCKKQGILTSGNAAGNSRNFEDLTGANIDIPTSDMGAIFRKRRRVRRQIEGDGKW